MPRRPPKRWMRACVKGVRRRSRKVKDAGAVCGALWYRKLSPARKKKILQREGRRSRRTRR